MSANAALQRPAAGHVDGVPRAQVQQSVCSVRVVTASARCLVLCWLGYTSGHLQWPFQMSTGVKKCSVTRGLPPALLLQDIRPCGMASLPLHSVRCCSAFKCLVTRKLQQALPMCGFVLPVGPHVTLCT